MQVILSVENLQSLVCTSVLRVFLHLVKAPTGSVLWYCTQLLLLSITHSFQQWWYRSCRSCVYWYKPYQWAHLNILHILLQFTDSLCTATPAVVHEQCSYKNELFNMNITRPFIYFYDLVITKLYSVAALSVSVVHHTPPLVRGCCLYQLTHPSSLIP